MQKTVNFIRGSVTLQAVGPYPERFLNICAAHGIRFWRTVQVDATTLRVTVARSQAKAAIRLGPKCMCEVTRVGSSGAPDFLLGFRRRYGMLLGMLLSVLSVLILSRFVLVIEITGNETVSDQSILAELKESGLYPGVYGPAVDERAVSNQVLLDMDELGFLSVNIHGIRAEVVVREADPAPEVEPTGVARDLTAAKSGRVLRVLSLAGTPEVSVGDLVEQGDTLISGTVVVTGKTDPDQVLSSYSVLAKGTVWAEVEETFSAATMLECDEKNYTGRSRNQAELTVLGQTFKISSKAFQPFAYYDKIESVHRLRLSENLTLPVSLTIYQCVEYEPETVQVNRESAETYLRNLLEERLEQAVGEDGEVIRSEWSVAEQSGSLTVSVTAQCLEQIAETG